MDMSPEILKYIDDHFSEAFDLLVELAQIPAPSHYEQKRAEFCLNWLIKQGLVQFYLNHIKNLL